MLTPTNDEKPTLRHIRDHHQLDLLELARAANVDPITIYLMEHRGHLHRADADRVLATVSFLTGQFYTRDNVGGFFLYHEYNSRDYDLTLELHHAALLLASKDRQKG